MSYFEEDVPASSSFLLKLVSFCDLTGSFDVRYKTLMIEWKKNDILKKRLKGVFTIITSVSAAIPEDAQGDRRQARVGEAFIFDTVLPELRQVLQRIQYCINEDMGDLTILHQYVQKVIDYSSAMATAISEERQHRRYEYQDRLAGIYSVYIQKVLDDLTRMVMAHGDEIETV